MQMTPTEIARVLDEIPSEVAWRRPDSLIKDSRDWFQVITPSSQVAPLNGVYRSILSPGRVDEAIEQTMEEFRLYGTPFRWVITGATLPSDFAFYLEKFNFKKDHEGLGLAVDTSRLLQLEKPAVEVIDLTEEHLDDWVDASVSGWGNPESFRQSLTTDVLRVLREQPKVLHYVSALVDGKVVGTGALRICKKSAHLIGSAVRPEFRGIGAYRALVIKRAEIAHRLGFTLMTTHGNPKTSGPILKGMGFQHYSDMVQYSFAFE